MAGVEEGGFLSVSTLAISPYYFETTERCLIATCYAHNSIAKSKKAKNVLLKKAPPFFDGSYWAKCEEIRNIMISDGSRSFFAFLL